MLSPKLVVVGLVGLLTFAATIATAEDAGAPGFVALENADFDDPTQPLGGGRFELRFDPADSARFSDLGGARRETSNTADYRRYEFSVIARNQLGFDVGFAQRAGLGVDRNGDIASRSRGSELRFGRLGSERPVSSEPSWYVFAASEDEAVTWRPGARNDFGGAASSFNVEDRVEIGDLQAGVTYERGPWQASLAYVEREYSTRSGARTISREENFTGLTLTMRH